MLEITRAEPATPGEQIAGAAWGHFPSRRKLLKQLACSALSMTGVIGFCNLLDPDPQLAGTVNALARRLPAAAGDPSSAAADGAAHSPSSPGGGFDPCNYREFLATLPLRHISIHQVVRCHSKKRGEVANTLPPRELWPNIGPTLLLADELGHRLGVPLLEITSAYRSPEYNALIQGAAEGSFHIRNQALDLRFDCPVSRVAEVAHRMRADGLFRGGIGIYPSFLHLDTRGKNVDWEQSAPAKA